MSPKKEKIFCAFCRTPHEVYKEKSFGFRHVFLSALMSVCLSFIIWKTYNPKSLLLFVTGLMLAEVFVRIRWRLHIACRACGFDPVVYSKNPQAAAESVKAFLKRRQEDPSYLLKKPLDLPSRPPEKTKSVKGPESKSLSTRI